MHAYICVMFLLILIVNLDFVFLLWEIGLPTIYVFLL